MDEITQAVPKESAADDKATLSPIRKVVNVASLVLKILIIAFTIFVLVFTVLSATMFKRVDRKIFGYRMLIVLSDSMSATDFDSGDLIFVKDVDPATLQEGDIITFQSKDPKSFGEIITHKIRRLTTDDKGNPGFVTYGTSRDNDDDTIVTYAFVYGKYVGKIAGIGNVLDFLQRPVGYIVCILLPFCLLMGWQAFNVVMLFKRYKKQQRAELEAEREKSEAERAETQKMKEELMALRAQLESTQTANAPTNAKPADSPSEGNPQ